MSDNSLDSSPGYSPGYSLGNVARILKVSPGRLRYWQRTKLVESLATGAAGDGYGFRDLVVLRAILSLVDKGIPLQRIRRNLETLRDRLPELDDPVAALRVFGEEPNRLVIRHAGRLEETGGQLLLEFGESDSDDEEGETSLLDFDSASTTGRAAGKAGADGSATPDDAISWFERGCELDADSENWSEAIEAYGKSIELFPDYADAYCNLGAIRYNQGQRAAARQAFETCLECQNDHIEANFNLSNVLEEVGEDGAALAHYRRALESDPLYPDLHVNLALLYEKLGRPRPGLEHWRRYLQIEPDGSWSDVARRKLDLESDQA